MAPDDKQHSSLPLGTSAGVFSLEGCSVIARIDLFQHLEFVFEDEEVASSALHCLRASLLLDDPVSTEFRHCHSPETSLSFIKKFIPRDCLIAVRWLARIRITVDGLECELPDGEWSDIELENVTCTYNWTQSPLTALGAPLGANANAADSNRITPKARLIMEHFGLSNQTDWYGVGRVYREDGMTLWYLDDDLADC